MQYEQKVFITLLVSCVIGFIVFLVTLKKYESKEIVSLTKMMDELILVSQQ